MPGKRLYIDNDIIILLGGSNTLSLALDALQFAPSNSYYLPALPYMIQKKSRSLTSHNPMVLDGALNACGQIQAIAESPSPDVMQRLTEVSQINSGEAVLFASAIISQDYFVATGDKVALNALCNTASLNDLRNNLQGKVICLETLMSHMVAVHGMPQVATRMTPVLGENKTLQIMFSDVNVRNPESFSQCCNSLIGDLDRRLGAGFLTKL